MDWEDAIQDAKEELGYGPDEYVEDWDRVVEEAHSILDYEKQVEYETFCENATNEYHEYLKSDEWKVKREEVLKRDNYICKDCGKVATEVHHENYEFLHTDEEKNYCVSLCNECHKKRHNIK